MIVSPTQTCAWGPQVAVRLAEFSTIAVNLIGKAVVYAAKWAGASRRRGLALVAAKPDGDKDKEILLLRDRVAQLQSQVEILRLLRKRGQHDSLHSA